MCLSIALAMSYTVSAAIDAAVSASISTPVCAVVAADAMMSTPVPPREREQRSTLAPGRASARTEPVGVQRAERAAKRIRGLLVIWEPPGNGNTTRVTVDELWRRELVEAVLGVRAPESGLA